MPTTPLSSQPAAPSEPQTILTSKGVADLLGISISTAQLWMENGNLPSWKTPGGHRRVHLSSVQRLQQRLAHQAGYGQTDVVPVRAERRDPAELSRLAAVARSGLSDGQLARMFDPLTWLAATVTAAPIALLTLVTDAQQLFLSRHGVTMTATPRDWAFCNYTIAQDDMFFVTDTLDDARFRDNPLVTGEPHMRFYAGVPLVDADGYKLGSLCVIDTEPRRLTGQQARALRELADIACREITVRGLLKP
ncbi:excisionase [Duganella sp. Leaf126]|uniref:GAF domain-containing protein n=1 Tax=Duganella sp. Leaf126 TaxID=1736266 RepID=UPI0006F75028|nr:GAF domain-containing protein [Duganella sp. Leaf126]KQQ33059.1 excisionase [Duganella sp. Leaf126]